MTERIVKRIIQAKKKTQVVNICRTHAHLKNTYIKSRLRHASSFLTISPRKAALGNVCFPSLSMLSTRDVNGYPLQGYDLVPERPKAKPKDTLSDLFKLLQDANEREEAANQCAELWHRAYLEVKQEYLAFNYEDL